MRTHRMLSIAGNIVVFGCVMQNILRVSILYVGACVLIVGVGCGVLQIIERLFDYDVPAQIVSGVGGASVAILPWKRWREAVKIRQFR